MEPKELTPLEKKQVEDLKDKRIAGFMKIGYSWLSKLFQDFIREIKETFKGKIEVNLPPPNVKIPPIKVPLIKIPSMKIPPIKVVVDSSKLERYFKDIFEAIKGIPVTPEPDFLEIKEAIDKLEKKIIQQVLPIQKGYLQVQLPREQVEHLITELAGRLKGARHVVAIGGRGAAPNFEDHDDLSSQVDGVNKVFTLKHIPIPGASLYLVYNGTVIEQKAANYALSGKEVTTVFTPETDTEFWAGYRY